MSHQFCNESYFALSVSQILSKFISGGPGLLLGGLVVAAASLGDLGSDSLSPFPAPPRGAILKTDGLYAKMRHPLYTGLLMTMAGLSIATNNADRLLLTAVLWYLLDVKSDKEEGKSPVVVVQS